MLLYVFINTNMWFLLTRSISIEYFLSLKDRVLHLWGVSICVRPKWSNYTGCDVFSHPQDASVMEDKGVSKKQGIILHGWKP